MQSDISVRLKIKKSPEFLRGIKDAKGKIPKDIFRSSLIQTLLSVLELHQIMRTALADFTADREFHPAPKIYSVF